LITLWGRLSSSNVQKVVWTLEELGMSYEHIPLAGKFGGNKTAEYLAMNPNGLVPTLRDDDLTIWESHAIVRYLAATYGAGNLWPNDPRERAIVDQWTDWTATTFGPAWIDLFWRFYRTPPEERDSKAIDKSMAGIGRCFAIMDGRLATSPFLGGSSLTYADIVAGVAMFRMTTMGLDVPLPSNVAAWHGRLNERAAYRKAVNVDYEELRGRLAF
jgi:glutathione S-transferase